MFNFTSHSSIEHFLMITFESYLVSQGQPKLTKVKRLFFQDGTEVKTIDDIEHDAELWMRLVLK